MNECFLNAFLNIYYNHQESQAYTLSVSSSDATSDMRAISNLLTQLLLKNNWTRKQNMIGLLMLAALATQVRANVMSLSELNTKIESGDLKRVGFLSHGNFHAVENELSSQVEEVIYAHAEDLYDAVQNGEVLAGLLSGTVDTDYDFNIFPSNQISIRAMFMKPGNDAMIRAIDAALVRVIESGGVEECARNNPPYEALVVHSCQADSSKFDWPALSEIDPHGNRTSIKIAALGPYQWGGADGDYTVTPHVGFWPDYYRLLEQQFNDTYGLTFERVWYAGSKGVMDSVLDGVTDTTEPYMMVGAQYVWCSSGYIETTQDKYFAKRVVEEDQSESNDDENKVIALSVVAVCVGVGLIAFIVLTTVMYFRERRGDPMFKAVLLPRGDEKISMSNIAPASKGTNDV